MQNITISIKDIYIKLKDGTKYKLSFLPDINTISINGVELIKGINYSLFETDKEIIFELYD